MNAKYLDGIADELREEEERWLEYKRRMVEWEELANNIGNVDEMIDKLSISNISKSQRKFLNWLTINNISDDSPIQDVLRASEHNFLLDILEDGYYDRVKKAEINNIISKLDDKVIERWKEYNSKS